MAKRIEGITIEIGGDTTKLSTALSKSDGVLKKTQTSLRDINKLLKLDPGNTDLLRQKQSMLASAIGETKKRLDTLREAERQLGEKPRTEEEQRRYEALQREIAETEQSLKRLTNEMREFGSVGAQKLAAVGQKAEEVGRKISAAGDKVAGAGRALLPVTGAVVGLGAAAVKTAATFEDAMASVQATLGITADATEELNGETVNVMDAMEKLARKMGAETKFSASQAAEAINILAMAGYDVQQIYDGLPQLLSLAAAGDLEIAEAADITTGILAGFNLGTEESAGVVDKLAKLASSAKGDVSSFGAGLSAVAGQAVTTGQSLDDAATALGLLGNNNVSATEGGKMLQRVLKNLYQPTDAARKELDALGVSAYNADGSARALPEVLEDLKAKLSSLDDEAKNGVMKKIFDTAAIRGANALIGSAGEGFDELKAKILDCEGAAQQMADVRMETMNGQLQILKSAVEEAGIAFGKTLLPTVTALVKKAQEAAAKINGMNDAQRKTVLRVAAVAAAVGPALIVAGKMIKTVGLIVTGAGKLLQLAPKVVSAVKAVKAALLATNPAVLAIVAAVGAVAAAVALSVKAVKKHATELYGLTDAQKASNEAIREQYDAMQENRAARDEENRGIAAQYGEYRRLWEELKNLTDENGRVREGEEARAAFIVSTLSEALGIEISLVDGVVQKNGELAASIDEVIRKKEAEALLAANQDDYLAARQAQTEALTDYVRKQNEAAEAERKLAEAKAHNDAVQMKNMSGVDIGYLVEAWRADAAVTEAQKSFDALSASAAEARAVYDDYTTTIANYSALETAISTGEGLAESMQNVAYGFQTAETASREALEQQLADLESTYALMQEAAETGLEGVTQTQLDEMASMVEKAKEQLRLGGEESGEQMADATETAILDGSGDVNAAGETLAAEAEAGASTADMEGVGSDYGDGLIRGMELKLAEVRRMAGQLGAAIDAGVRSREGIDAHSPSRKAKLSAADYVSGAIEGARERLGDLRRTGVAIAAAMQTPGPDALIRAPGLNYAEGARAQTGAAAAGAGAPLSGQATRLLGMIYERLDRMEIRLDGRSVGAAVAGPVNRRLGDRAALESMGVI